MIKLFAVGLSVVSMAGGQAHHKTHHRYWWPAMVTCQLGGAPTGGTAGQPTQPVTTCVNSPAHYGSTPPPAMVGVPMTAVEQQAKNYNPYGKNGY